MARLTKEQIIEAMLLRVCETKNVLPAISRNYFVNIYMDLPKQYNEFLTCARTLFDLNGYNEDEVIPTIYKYFDINNSIN